MKSRGFEFFIHPGSVFSFENQRIGVRRLALADRAEPNGQPKRHLVTKQGHRIPARLGAISDVSRYLEANAVFAHGRRSADGHVRIVLPEDQHAVTLFLEGLRPRTRGKGGQITVNVPACGRIAVEARAVVSGGPQIKAAVLDWMGSTALVGALDLALAPVRHQKLLSHLRPRALMNDVLHRGLSQTKGRCDGTHRFTGRTAGPNTPNLALSQSSQRMGFTARAASAVAGAAFGDHVSHVVRVGAEEEMGFVDAARVVATMEYPLPFWDEAVRQLVSKAVRLLIFTGDRDLAVPEHITSADPLPTWTKFRTVRWNGPVLIDPRPESFD
jgi:hypothetical protein